MATLKIFTSLAVLFMLLNLAMGANLTVGAPNGGWDTTTSLQAWASSQLFSVGDNLVFQYSLNHDVLEVTKADHDACQTGNPIQVHMDGNTIIPLSSPGKRYFICGTSGHCGQGMKLEVDTIAAATAPPPANPLTPPPTSIVAPPPATPLTPPPTSTVAPPPATPLTPPPTSIVTPPTSSPPKTSPQPSTPSPVLPPSRSPSPKSPSAPAKSPSSSPKLSPKVPATESPLMVPSASPSSSPPPSGSTTAPSPSSASQAQAKLTVGFGFGIMMLLAL